MNTLRQNHPLSQCIIIYHPEYHRSKFDFRMFLSQYKSLITESNKYLFVDSDTSECVMYGNERALLWNNI